MPGNKMHDKFGLRKQIDTHTGSYHFAVCKLSNFPARLGGSLPLFGSLMVQLKFGMFKRTQMADWFSAFIVQ